MEPKRTVTVIFKGGPVPIPGADSWRTASNGELNLYKGTLCICTFATSAWVAVMFAEAESEPLKGAL